jgi:hypothetical protein
MRFLAVAIAGRKSEQAGHAHVKRVIVLDELFPAHRMHDRGFQLAREFDQLRVRSGTTRSSLQEARRGGRRERQIHFLRAVSSPPTITTRATCSGIDAFQSCHDSARQRQRKFALFVPSHDGRRGDRGMIPPSQYIHHATVSVKGIPLGIRPCLHKYGRDPASGVDLRCARGDVGVPITSDIGEQTFGRIGQRRRIRRIRGDEVDAAEGSAHGFNRAQRFHPLSRASPVPRRPARRASIAGRCAPSNAAVPTSACRHVPRCRRLAGRPYRLATMATGLRSSGRGRCHAGRVSSRTRAWGRSVL